jgi:cell wall assembly regulator SMI1
MSVTNAWAEIEAWLAVNAPSIRKSLRPPGKDTALKKLRTKFGLSLPLDFLQSVQVHDGQKTNAEHGLFPGGQWELGPLPSCQLLTLAEIGTEWAMMKELFDDGNFAGQKSEPARGIRDDWWNPGWIPIAGNGGGDYFCLDLAPAKTGTSGQFIMFFHDMDERRLIAKSYAAWLEELAKGFASGRYILDKDEGIVEPDADQE